MLQQQINYWNLKETMRHNRVGERIYQQDADTNRINARVNIKNANTNRINANTNIFNSKVNAMNAVSNRIQANASTTMAGAAVTQAGAAVRQAGASERQASVSERNVAVTEKLANSKQFSNYASPFGSALGSAVRSYPITTKSGKSIVKSSKMPKVGRDGYYVLDTAKKGVAAGVAATGVIGLGLVGGAAAIGSVYNYNKTHPEMATTMKKSRNK